MEGNACTAGGTTGCGRSSPPSLPLTQASRSNTSNFMWTILSQKRTVERRIRATSRSHVVAATPAKAPVETVPRSSDIWKRIGFAWSALSATQEGRPTGSKSGSPAPQVDQGIHDDGGQPTVEDEVDTDDVPRSIDPKQAAAAAGVTLILGAAYFIGRAILKGICEGPRIAFACRPLRASADAHCDCGGEPRGCARCTVVKAQRGVWGDLCARDDALGRMEIA